MMSPRASIFGGSWLNDDNAGSRYANLDNWPENSNDNLGARGRSDDGLSLGKASRTSPPSAAPLDEALPMARVRLRPPRPATRGGQSAQDQGLWSARLSCFGKHTSRSGRAGRRGWTRITSRSAAAIGGEVRDALRKDIFRDPRPAFPCEAT